MKTTFRLQQAILRAQSRGIVITKAVLAAKLWPDSNERTQRVSMNKLCRGYRASIRPEWVTIICQTCDCTPNYLFGYEEN